MNTRSRSVILPSNFSQAKETPNGNVNICWINFNRTLMSVISWPSVIQIFDGVGNQGWAMSTRCRAMRVIFSVWTNKWWKLEKFEKLKTFFLHLFPRIFQENSLTLVSENSWNFRERFLGFGLFFVQENLFKDEKILESAENSTEFSLSFFLVFLFQILSTCVWIARRR